MKKGTKILVAVLAVAALGMGAYFVTGGNALQGLMRNAPKISQVQKMEPLRIPTLDVNNEGCNYNSLLFSTLDEPYETPLLRSYVDLAAAINGGAVAKGGAISDNCEVFISAWDSAEDRYTHLTCDMDQMWSYDVEEGKGAGVGVSCVKLDSSGEEVVDFVSSRALGSSDIEVKTYDYLFGTDYYNIHKLSGFNIAIR